MNDKPVPPSHPTDPRLRSFLRKSAAIIATGRGLNAATQVKLQALASHLKLPDDLYETALVQLHANSGSASLTRYEKAFSKFISSELENLKGDVLSLEMENKAVQLAKDKYQISETRAEQLIHTLTEAMGVSRISPEESRRYAENTIAERIGPATSLDPEALQQIVDIGQKWGLDESQIQPLIRRQFELNRKRKRSSGLYLWPLAFAATILASIGMSIVVFGDGRLFRATSRTEQPDTPGTQSSKRTPPWMSPATVLQLNSLVESKTVPRSAVDDIVSEDAQQRNIGYHSLFSIAMNDQVRRQDDVANMLAQLYCQEPQSESANTITDLIDQYIQTPLTKRKPNVEDLHFAYQANRILGNIFRHANATVDSNPGRGQALASEIELGFEPGTGMSTPTTLQGYLQQSEPSIAGNQWNRIAQMAWLDPSHAAHLVQPLVDLTRGKIAPDLFEQYRDETVLAILESDGTAWKKISGSARESITTCSETNLIQWVDLFRNSTDASFRETISTSLVKRLGIRPLPRQPEQIADAIVDFGTRYRHRILGPALNRSESIDERETALLARETPDSNSLADQIANMTLAVNIEMAFSAAINNATHIGNSSFVGFDRLISNPPFELQNVISLPGDQRFLRGNARLPITASDRRRMKSALEQLQDLTTHSSIRRERALSELEQIAIRFDRISWSDATVLARYFLADLDVREKLNTQRLADSFSHWPNLSLALADQIAGTDVDRKLAFTIARLLIQREVDIESDSEWRQQLSTHILAAVESELARQPDRQIDDPHNNWERLRVYLLDSGQIRLLIHRLPKTSTDESVRPHDATLALIKAMRISQTSATEDLVLDRAMAGVSEVSPNEIEQTLFANQLLIRVLARQFKSNETAAAAESLIAELQQTLLQQTMPGNQLLETERTILRLLILSRRIQIEQLLQRPRQDPRPIIPASSGNSTD